MSSVKVFSSHDGRRAGQRDSTTHFIDPCDTRMDQNKKTPLNKQYRQTNTHAFTIKMSTQSHKHGQLSRGLEHPTDFRLRANLSTRLRRSAIFTSEYHIPTNLDSVAFQVGINHIQKKDPTARSNQLLACMNNLLSNQLCSLIIIIIIIAFKGAIRDFLQSPHSAANCLQHARSSGPGAIVCKSRATHRALITCKCHVTCHLVRRDSSAIKFD